MPHATVARDSIASTELDSAGTIILIYADLVRSSAHLPHLIHRVRQRAPGARIVAGLWPSAADPIPYEALCDRIGADVVCRSLAEMAAALGNSIP